MSVNFETIQFLSLLDEFAAKTEGGNFVEVRDSCLGGEDDSRHPDYNILYDKEEENALVYGTHYDAPEEGPDFWTYLSDEFSVTAKCVFPEDPAEFPYILIQDDETGISIEICDGEWRVCS